MAFAIIKYVVVHHWVLIHFQSCEMKDTFPELEVLAMFVACLCHDLDHRGTNNSFQAK